MAGINGEDVPANGFGLFGLVEITVEFGFGDGLGDAGLGDGLELVFRRTSCFVAYWSNQTIKEFLPGKLSELARCSRMAELPAADLPEQHGQRIVKLVHHALFERDDGIVGDSNLFGADLRATFCDVAKTQAELILEQAGSVAAVEGMHFEAGDSNEETWARELLLFVVFAKYVAHVLAEKAFDTLSKLLDAVHIKLGDFPFHSLTGFEGRDFAVDTIVPGNVGDKVFDSRKGFHGEDGDRLILRKIIHARFAGQARAAVDFRRARATLPGLAVPADGEVRSEVPLNVMQRVEDNHAGRDGNAIVNGLPAIRIAAKNTQGRFFHVGSLFLERCMASSHSRGSADPRTFHLVNFVGPMWGIMACMACSCGIFVTKSVRAFSSAQAERVQKLRLKSLARREYPMTPGVARNCF